METEATEDKAVPENNEAVQENIKPPRKKWPFKVHLKIAIGFFSYIILVSFLMGAGLEDNLHGIIVDFLFPFMAPLVGPAQFALTIYLIFVFSRYLKDIFTEWKNNGEYRGKLVKASLLFFLFAVMIVIAYLSFYYHGKSPFSTMNMGETRRMVTGIKDIMIGGSYGSLGESERAAAVFALLPFAIFTFFSSISMIIWLRKALKIIKNENRADSSKIPLLFTISIFLLLLSIYIFARAGLYTIAVILPGLAFI